jgi:hypothetical protein
MPACDARSKRRARETLGRSMCMHHSVIGAPREAGCAERCASAFARVSGGVSSSRASGSPCQQVGEALSEWHVALRLPPERAWPIRLSAPGRAPVRVLAGVGSGSGRVAGRNHREPHHERGTRGGRSVQRNDRNRSPIRGNLQYRPAAAREVCEKRCHAHGEILGWALSAKPPVAIMLGPSSRVPRSRANASNASRSCSSAGAVAVESAARPESKSAPNSLNAL